MTRPAPDDRGPGRMTGPGRAAEPGGRPDPARWRRLAAPHGERYGLLLFLLVFTYVLSASASGVEISASQVLLFMWVLLLVLRAGRRSRRASRLITTAVVAGSVGTASLSLLLGSPGARAAADLWTALVLLLAVGMIVARILAHQEITIQSLLGAISAYLIIGLMFASVYRAVGLLGGGFFAAGDSGARLADQSVSTYQYFSFTTLTTLGYGDYTAAGNDGRAIAVLEALSGQVFLATLVARLVAAFRPQSRQAQSRQATGHGQRGHGQQGDRRHGQGQRRQR